MLRSILRSSWSASSLSSSWATSRGSSSTATSSLWVRTCWGLFDNHDNRKDNNSRGLCRSLIMLSCSAQDCISSFYLLFLVLKVRCFTSLCKTTKRKHWRTVHDKAFYRSIRESYHHTWLWSCKANNKIITNYLQLWW